MMRIAVEPPALRPAFFGVLNVAVAEGGEHRVQGTVCPWLTVVMLLGAGECDMSPTKLSSLALKMGLWS